MSLEKINAPDMTAIISEAMRKTATEQSNFSLFNFTTADFDGQVFSIERILPQGIENALSAKELACSLGTDRRIAQRWIAEERKHGALILSTPDRIHGGYFRPSEGEQGVREINRYLRSMRSRAFNILQVCAALESRLKADNSEQISLWEDKQ